MKVNSTTIFRIVEFLNEPSSYITPPLSQEEAMIGHMLGLVDFKMDHVNGYYLRPKFAPVKEDK